MADTTPYPIKVTRDAIVDAGACPEGIAAFDAVVPDGTLTIADSTAHVALLVGPLGRFEEWALEEGLLPPIHIVAGSYGRAMAGHRGQATAGAYGQATAGVEGRATAGVGGRATAGYGGRAAAGGRGLAAAGAGGRATAGYGGTATAGEWGTATAGEWGTAMAGYGGRAAVGYGGRIQIDWYARRRVRTAVGYIGETADKKGDVLAPDVAYKVDDEGRFYRA